MNNPWDSLAPIYATVKSDSDITTNNADNILIAWPVILDFIKKFEPKEKKLSVLDYGCGTGNFAYKLYKLGYNVTGIDSSKEMIEMAKEAFSNIPFIFGDSLILSHQNRFSIITSIMTFQFIENIECTFKDIANAMRPGGLFVFSVFNPAFIKKSLRTKIFFEDFDSFERPKVGIFNLNGNKLSVFIRTAQEYNQMLKKLNFEPLLESYPFFTEEFLKKYPITNLINESEYLILGYRKIG
jgi:SAM-dependent methyltransferase